MHVGFTSSVNYQNISVKQKINLIVCRPDLSR